MSGNYGASYCDGPHLADDCPNCVNILGESVLDKSVEVKERLTAHALARILLDMPDETVKCYLNDFDAYNITHVSCTPGRGVEIDLGIH
jgi:hypothetical protein